MRRRGFASRVAAGLVGVVAMLAGLAMTAGCGGTNGAESQPGTEASGDNAATSTTTPVPSEGVGASSGSLSPLVKLCEVPELSKIASALYPGQHIKCIPGHGTPTPAHQVSNAAWSAGEVNPRTYVITDEHTIQASIEGNTPDNESSAPSFIYDGDCHSSTGIQCEDQEDEIEGTDCQMRTQVLEIGGPTIKTWQVACYLGRDSKTGLDVRVQTAATKLESAQGIEDFTAAVIRAARND